jgi:hypothetical protein
VPEIWILLRNRILKKILGRKKTRLKKRIREDNGLRSFIISAQYVMQLEG